MDTARISALLGPFLDFGVSHGSRSPRLEHTLSAAQLEQISTYIDLLLRWNARINLTAIRDPESIVTRHFGESLFLARHVLPSIAEPLSKTSIHPETQEISPLAENHDAPAAERRDRPARHIPVAVIAEGEKSLAGDTDVASGHDHSSGSNAVSAFNAPAAERRKITAHGASRGSPSEKENPAPLGAKEKNAAAARVLDIGSGAGFPGLPLKIWAPHVSLTLIESNHKKSAFLREVSRALTLTDINVITERAETLSVPPADLVTFRAVERFEKILPLAARFLAPSGRLAVLIGTSQFSTLTALTPKLHWLSPTPIPRSQSRLLAISGT